MAHAFKLPDIGEGISEAELLQWYVKEGEAVAENQNLAEIETDKAVADLPSPYEGTVLRLHYRPGDRIAVGSVLVTFADGGGEADAPAAAVAAPQTDEVQVSEPGARRVQATPAVRRRARELGVELAAVQGTGPGGRVTREDVERSAEQPQQAPAAAGVETTPSPQPTVVPERAPSSNFGQWGPIERVALSATRKQIARKMVQALFTAPHAAALDEVDITELESFRRRAQQQDQGVRLTLLPFVMKATVAGLKRFPILNASLDQEKQELVLKRYYHLGIAVDSARGLIVPVIRDVDRKSVIELAAELGELVARTRAGKVAIGELQGGTFTLTNAGAVGGSSFIPIINYPEVAILGMGRAQEKPVVRGGGIVVRTMLPLSIAFDHRVVDGADVIRFLKVVMGLLEDPTRLLLEGV